MVPTIFAMCPFSLLCDISLDICMLGLILLITAVYKTKIKIQKVDY